MLLCTLGGTSAGWGSPVVVGLGAATIVLLGSFVLAERRAAEAVMPQRLFGNRVFSVTSAMGLVVGFALFGSVTYLPLFVQVVMGASPTGSGLQLLPLMGGLLITSISSGQPISRTGRYKPFPIAGTAIMVIGLGLLSTMDASSGRLAASGYMFVLGLGLGLVMQVRVLAVQNAVDHSDLGVATSGASLFRSIGGSVGTAVLGAMFSNRLSSELAATLPASASRQLGSSSARENPAALAKLPPSIHSTYIHAFTSALSTVFEVAAAIAVFAFGSAGCSSSVHCARASRRAAGSARASRRPSRLRFAGRGLTRVDRPGRPRGTAAAGGAVGSGGRRGAVTGRLLADRPPAGEPGRRHRRAMR